MLSHSMYSSATALQFSYQNQTNCSFVCSRKMIVEKEEKNVKPTHFMSRMFPGEYWRNNVLIGNPQWMHLSSISTTTTKSRLNPIEIQSSKPLVLGPCSSASNSARACHMSTSLFSTYFIILDKIKYKKIMVSKYGGTNKMLILHRRIRVLKK